ncbi:acetyl-CoA carboxylase biotin carboxyl carrier protein [Roseofilum casamattae]|uniref:Biotin carboxyl carrier protein of acetyl-CoA carboxylase n=1 Tax=Roseofilum casamattae BLCC-M143 TaxID=3022442 RepID=A0ABT7BXX1_9CYAN|nr:acetyl-CoA carboxylase biotin carboxyl carrier protein [Roseofilum casamattae]MDJ1183128.1 acetyl-CoA carboxylase biotin carboxyl carrier protein [Roseofilum casamattae BLCC-M143]
MNLNFEELRELIVTLGQTDIAEFTLKNDSFELTVRKGVAEGAGVIQQVAIAPPVMASAMPTVAAPVVPSAPAPVAPSEPTPPPLDRDLLEIKSPMVGTFYRAPAPDEAPFTSVGDRIQLGDTVCIIEAMKLMNELEAEVAGEVVEILVENAEPVEYGQVLMRVKAS